MMYSEIEALHIKNILNDHGIRYYDLKVVQRNVKKGAIKTRVNGRLKKQDEISIEISHVNWYGKKEYSNGYKILIQPKDNAINLSVFDKVTPKGVYSIYHKDISKIMDMVAYCENFILQKI